LFNGDEEGLQIYEFVNLLGPPTAKEVFFLTMNCETDVGGVFAEVRT